MKSASQITLGKAEDSLIAADCLSARNYKSHEIRKMRPKKFKNYLGLAYSYTFLRELESLW